MTSTDPRVRDNQWWLASKKSLLYISIIQCSLAYAATSPSRPCNVHLLAFTTASSTRALSCKSHFPDSAAAPAPPALELSMDVAPSAFSFFSVWSRWYSITLRFLKYVTCPLYQPSALSHTPHHTSEFVHTQLLAHALSNSLSSGAHSFFAFSSSRTLSMMLLRSRHLKKLSRPSQHCARALRSGAMKPPSCEGAGGGGEGCELEVPNQPMVESRCVCVVYSDMDRNRV